MRSKHDLFLLLAVMSLAATNLCAEPITIYPNEQWNWVEVDCTTAPDCLGSQNAPSVTFYVSLESLSGPIAVHVTDAFTSGDVYRIQATSPDQSAVRAATTGVSNDPLLEVDEGNLGDGPSVQSLGDHAWNDSFAGDPDGLHPDDYSSASFNLTGGHDWLITLTVTQWATDCYGTTDGGLKNPACTVQPDAATFGQPYTNAGVFIWVDPPVDGPATPEPATFALVGLGLAAVAFVSRRRRARQ